VNVRCFGQTDHPTRRISCQKAIPLNYQMDFCRTSERAAGCFRCALGTACTTSRRRQQRFVLRVKWRVGDVQMDFPAQSLAKFSHGDRVWSKNSNGLK